MSSSSASTSTWSHNRLTGYGSGSTAVVKCHVITDGFPVYTIKTADGRTLVGNDAELWEYRTVIDKYRLKQNPSTKWTSGF